ncbi:hypothetical protein ACVRWF_05625 [Streptococcus uberis]
MANTIIPLFHCNDTNVTSELLQKKLTISTHSADKEWGGYGMYFWDNKGNANFWATKKSGDAVIVKSYIAFDSDKDLLDLTDHDVELVMENILQKIEDKLPLDALIGDKIDTVCEMLKVKIVKFFGKYEHMPQNKLINEDTKLTNKVKIIYCIKEGNDSLLTECTIVKE